MSSLRKFNPEGLYPPLGAYHNAVEVPEGYRLIFSAGLIGADINGGLSQDPAHQIDQAWKNVATFIEGAGMTPDNLTRLTMHLTDQDHIAISKAARIRALGEHMHCAVTGLIVQLFDPDLFIEIDVVLAGPKQ